MTFTTTNFAFYVYIYLDEDVSLKLSDNFFDLSPDWPVIVSVLSFHKLSQIQSMLRIRTIYDTFN